MKTSIGASLLLDLFEEFCRRSLSTVGGKSGLIKAALLAYFAANPFPRNEQPAPIPSPLPQADEPPAPA